MSNGPGSNDEQAEFEKLHAEYRAFVLCERVAWLKQNPPPTNERYEVMSSRNQREVHGIITRWEVHITPLAEKWWKERGYTIHWPENPTAGCHFTKD
jgi:hypothetical protein